MEGQWGKPEAHLTSITGCSVQSSDAAYRATGDAEKRAHRDTNTPHTHLALMESPVAMARATYFTHLALSSYLILGSSHKASSQKASRKREINNNSGKTLIFIALHIFLLTLTEIKGSPDASRLFSFLLQANSITETEKKKSVSLIFISFNLQLRSVTIRKSTIW